MRNMRGGKRLAATVLRNHICERRKYSNCEKFSSDTLCSIGSWVYLMTAYLLQI